MSHVMDTYARQPVAFVRGEGVWLWDEDGNKYLDALAGIAVNTLGHAHPKLTRALAEQAARVLHTSNLFRAPWQEAAAERLASISGLDEAFFCNSGCEANEAAIKVARKYGHDRGINEPAIVVMENAFHGRTLATLSATGSRKVQAGFEPLVTGFVRVPHGDLEAVEKIAANNRNVVAVLVEPIQGEGGIQVAGMDYLRGLRALCDRNEWLLMLDEVQCGLGRTGKWFVYQHAGILPDVLPLAKGLGSGLPVGACLVAGRAKGVFKRGNHGSTFGGNPLVCAAVIATLDAIRDEGLLDNALRVGDAIRGALATQLAGLPGVVEVRGMGMMIGVELSQPCGEIVKASLDAGLVVNVTAETVIRLLPPLVMSEAEGQLVVERLVPLVRARLAQAAPQASPQPAAAGR
ncbi:MAG: aspartate aminotransferase family protein [Betaproteobacteria bacterium]|nr:aspartate aminotransferase family protein [Betaproteobacteria bacterium]